MAGVEVSVTDSATEWPVYTGFIPLLSNRMIRLLQLDSTASSNNLRYNMQYAELGAQTYCAVSYCWGAPVPAGALKLISINGETVWIRPTLHSFLETMALNNLGMGLWIDAICIDQRNARELNHQISIMGEIYKNAKDVYVWLGIGDDDTSYVFEHIEVFEPETRFDKLTFSTCAEKLFRASYWTRRWVIQEFALAQELTIVCGKHMTKWCNLTTKIDKEVLEINAPAQQTFQNFKEIKSHGPEQKQSLLELMERYKHARCIDPRDKVFALCGIANDGNQISPHYDESLANVYFRVLSMLPTERVLPSMSGYRWPHDAACRLQDCMQLTSEDVLGSLVSRTSDRLVSVFEYTGVISAVQKPSRKNHGPDPTNEFCSFPLDVRLQGWENEVFCGDGLLMSGDLVYSLQSTPKSPRGLYIAFRGKGGEGNVVGMLINEPNTAARTYWASMGLRAKHIKLVNDIILAGILQCSRNTSALPSQDRVLCHINRLVLILLWLLDSRQVDCLLNSQTKLLKEYVEMNLTCYCLNDSGKGQRLNSNGSRHQKNYLEIFPSFEFQADRFWAKTNTLPWIDIGQKLSEERNEIDNDPWGGKNSVKSWLDRHSAPAYAARNGYIQFIEHFISQEDAKLYAESAHRSRKTPLLLAAYEGHEKVVQALLGKRPDGSAPGLRGLGGALCAAAGKGHESVVRMLLLAGADLNWMDHDGREPLALAKRNGHKAMVQLLQAASTNQS
jgi:hypothetical protein